DIDISVFLDGQHALFAHLDGWNLVAHDATLPDSREPWDGRPLELPAHIHARPPGDENSELVRRWVTPPYRQAGDGQDFDFVLNERDSTNWVLNREPLVTLQLERAL